MRSDDLVPMLVAEPGPQVGYRQGEIVTWNQDTAENTVRIAGSILSNLPIVNPAEASILTAGDVVAVISIPGGYAILGRLVIPGTPQAVSSIQSITNRIQAASNSGAGTRNSTSWGDLTGTGVGPAVTIRIGSSGRALVFWSAELGMVVSSTTGTIQKVTRSTPHIGVQVSGASSVAPDEFNALNVNIDHPASGFAGAALTAFWIQSAMCHLFTGLTPGDNTFTLKYRHDNLEPSSGNTSRFEAREIAVFAL